MLVITGVILFLASRKKDNNKNKVDIKNSIMVGLGQALTVLPGISRSGLTISTGIFSGLKSERAAEFSFLLAIPLIAGATVLEVPKLIQISSNLILIYLIGVLVSFVVSLFSLKLLMKILKLNQKKLVYFAYYCLFIGLAVILMV
jgi:undecaprenyl-diphosphatase